jgi:hypothetical protein
LDQNDKIRAQIQAEEREKAKDMIAAELAAAKGGEGILCALFS